jgi:hypothetical protein
MGRPGGKRRHARCHPAMLRCGPLSQEGLQDAALVLVAGGAEALGAGDGQHLRAAATATAAEGCRSAAAAMLGPLLPGSLNSWPPSSHAYLVPVLGDGCALPHVDDVYLQAGSRQAEVWVAAVRGAGSSLTWARIGRRYAPLSPTPWRTQFFLLVGVMDMLPVPILLPLQGFLQAQPGS